MQKVLSAKEWMARGCGSWAVAEEIVETALDGVASHITDKTMGALMAPYITEAGLSVALEFSYIQTFEPDSRGFYMDCKQDRAEPKRAPIDGYCNDRPTIIQTEKALHSEYDGRGVPGSPASKKRSVRGSPVGSPARGVEGKPTSPLKTGKR
jgi:hypothetical protein